jgi:uncharacterized membrane protein YfcA
VIDFSVLVDLLPTPTQAVGLLAVALVAGVIRGLTGFGAALLMVPGLSLFLHPAEAVPTSMMAIAATNLPLLPGAWRESDKRMVAICLVGCLATIPFGIWLLAVLPADILRRAIGASVVVAGLLLLHRGFRLKQAGHGLKLLAGAVSGLMNGSVGMGGPPVILIMLAMPLAPAVARASLILYFSGLNSISVIGMTWAGLFTKHTLVWSLLIIPPLVGAARLGEIWFRRGSGAQFRPIAIAVLIGTGVVALAKG